MLCNDASKLAGLLRSDAVGVVEVLIDELLVADVCERHKVGGGGEEKGKTPGWHDLDQEVREEGGDECLHRS